MTPQISSLVPNTSPLTQHDPLVSDRVESLLRQEVASRRHEPNAKLKHEMDLAEQFKVSRKTVRAAMARLKKEDLVYAIRGKGTFIRPSKRTNITLIACHQYHPHSMLAIGVVTSLLREQGCNTNLIISNHLKRDWAGIEMEQSASMGVLLVGVFREQDLCWLAKNAKMPFVLLGDTDATIRKPTQYNHVLPSASDLVFRATDYLLGQGHTKIGYLTWNKFHEPAYITKAHDGFITALNNRGLKPNPAWSITLPPAHFTEGQQPTLCSLGETKKQFDHWFNHNEIPTALIIHSALELQIRDLLESYCRNRLTLESVVAITPYEQLPISYCGMGKLTAVCYRFEYLAQRALAMLVQQSTQRTSPIREICDQSFICFRNNGVWDTTDSMDVVQPSASFVTAPIFNERL